MAVKRVSMSGSVVTLAFTPVRSCLLLVNCTLLCIKFLCDAGSAADNNWGLPAYAAGCWVQPESVCQDTVQRCELFRSAVHHVDSFYWCIDSQIFVIPECRKNHRRTFLVIWCLVMHSIVDQLYVGTGTFIFLMSLCSDVHTYFVVNSVQMCWIWKDFGVFKRLACWRWNSMSSSMLIKFSNIINCILQIVFFLWCGLT